MFNASYGYISMKNYINGKIYFVKIYMKCAGEILEQVKSPSKDCNNGHLVVTIRVCCFI